MTESTSILLADDHALVRGTLQVLIDSAPGFRVVASVGNTNDAVLEAMRTRPDIVLLDIDMPGQYCFEAARTIKAQLPDALVVFLSAFHHDRYIEQAISVEAAGYISKSEPPEQVLAALRLVVSGGMYYSPEVQMRIVVDKEGSPRLASAGHSRLSSLSRRELEVLRYIALGHSRKETAKLMNVTPRTVDAHTQRVMDKLNIHDRVELTRCAIREGLAQA